MKRLTFKAITFLSLSPWLVFGNPSGPQVVKGKASFRQAGQNELHVKTSDQAVINWQDFSIGAGEYTKFIQSSKDSKVLNRVVSGNPSSIMGTLEGNGKVYLINPNGLLVGKDGVINTASFLASTIDISDETFLQASDLPFSGDTKATIINYGTVSAWDGDVTLVGYQVENQGTITALNGTVSIGAGQEILLKPDSEEKLFIRPQKTNDRSDSQGIVNVGKIEALQVELKADGNPYALAINQAGRVDALNVSQKGGRIFLVAEEGNTELSGSLVASGGEIKVLGKQVHLTEKALVDASAAENPGKFYVGGGVRGQDPAIYNAQKTIVDAGATIRSDAQNKGMGGEVVVWSAKDTQFYGKISAQGGNESGNGGFVEVSGKNLAFKGEVTTAAANGQAGTLLLDPTDIYIQDSGTTTLTQSVGIDFVEYSDTVGAPVGVLTVTDLNAALATNNVIVSTTSTSDADGDIFLELTGGTPIQWTTSNTLTLDADRDVIWKLSIQPGNNSGLSIFAGRDMIIDGGTLQSSANYVSVNVKAIRDITFGESTQWNQVGNVAFDAGRNIAFGNSNVFSITNVVNATQPITETFYAKGNVTIGDSATFTLGDSPIFKSENFNLGASVITLNQTSTVANRNLTIEAKENVVLAAASSLNINVNGNSSISAGHNFSTGQASTLLYSSGGNLDVTAKNNILLGNLSQYGWETVAGNFTLIADKSIIASGPVTISSVAGSTVTLVADNEYPTRPEIGHGYISIPEATITASGGIRLFSAARGLDNFEDAIFNSFAFVPGPKFVNTATEQWNSYYPSTFGGTPYTSFYKNHQQEMTDQIFFKYYAALTEPFQRWNDYDRFEFGYDLVSFMCSDCGGRLNCDQFWTIPFQVVENEPAYQSGDQQVSLLEGVRCFYNLYRAVLHYRVRGPIDFVSQRGWACASQDCI